jgi:hypothetical protein
MSSCRLDILGRNRVHAGTTKHVGLANSTNIKGLPPTHDVNNLSQYSPTKVETMLHLKMLNLGFVLSLFLVPIVAKDVPPIGCNDLSCPKQGTDFRCKVEDNTFLGVGLAPIPNLPSDLEGFSLVKGVNVSAGLAGKNNDKPTRPFKSVYYLATPEDTEAQDIRGCAVIFNNPPEKKFKGPELEGINKTDTRAATGTCSDVIEQRCIDAIVQKARNVTGDTDGSICKKLEHELKGTFTGCSGFADHGSSLGNFSIKSFGDLGAVRNSSDCWPVQQKSDQLMDIGEVTSYVS